MRTWRLWAGASTEASLPYAAVDLAFKLFGAPCIIKGHVTGMNQLRRVFPLNRAQLLLVLASLLFTACGLLGGGTDEASQQALGHQTQLPPQSQAILTCSEECAARGWCGTTDDERQVVLGNAENVSAVPQDRVFLHGSIVFINLVSMATIESVATGQQAQLPFYLVTSPEQGRSAWVAGWCIASAPGE
jgi:hypothetical protein